MSMKMREAAVLAALALSASGGAQAQTRFTDEQIVTAISRCMRDNAPDDWQTLIFKLAPAPAGAGASGPDVIEHKVIAGSPNNPPQDLVPCRADYVPKAVNTFRENQDDKARRWTGIVILIQRDGTFSVTYSYPK